MIRPIFLSVFVANFLGCTPADTAKPAAVEVPAASKTRSFPRIEKETAGALLEFSSRSDDDPLRQLTADGLALLKQFEGQVLCAEPTVEQRHCPYNDSSNYCTIGFGHLVAKSSCEDLVDELTTAGFLDGISESKADELLTADLRTSQQGVEKNIDGKTGLLGRAELSPSQYDALVSFTFNVGVGNFNSSTLLKKLLARADVSGNAAVAKQFVRWTLSDGKHVNGLLNRRNKEVDHFFSGYERPATSKSDDEEPLDIRLGETP